MATTIGTSWTKVASYQFIPGTGFRATFYLEARYSSGEKNNIEGNYSNIYTRLRSEVNAGQGSGYNYEFTCSYAPTVSSTSYLWTIENEVITESPAVKITHNDDGTKTIRLSATMRINGVGLNASMAGDVILDTIPRATKLANQVGTIGQMLDIKWIKASTSFTHKLTYSFGNIEDEILGEELVDGFSWEEIPEKLYPYFPESPYGEGVLKLTTYNGDKQIGATQEAKLTINANKNFSDPVMQSTNITDINSSTVALTGDDSTFVLNKSIVFLELTFKTRNYSKLKILSINNKLIDISTLEVIENDDGSTQYGFQEDMGVITNNKYNIVMTDTRDFSQSYDLTIGETALIKYIPLEQSFIFKRIQPTTGEVGTTFSGKYFNGSFGLESNELSISYRYKKNEDEDYSDLIIFEEGTHYTIGDGIYYSGTSTSASQVKLSPFFDYRYVYNIQVNVSDKLTTLPVINIIVVKGIPIMWWNGEKVTINGELYIADKDGNNPVNVKDMAGGVTLVRWESE